MKKKLNETDYYYLSKCIDLAEEALEAGDKPFGSILVDHDKQILAKRRNRVNEINALSHPEYELAKWALENLTENERKLCTMYTSGEHCPMCAGAHGMANIGTVVYAASGHLYTQWLHEFGAPPALIKLLPIEDIVHNINVRGPAEGELLHKIKALHKKSVQQI